MDISKLSESAKDQLLNILVNRLDELDEDDYFGTEGWETFFGVENW